jgi:hypothetical protein
MLELITYLLRLLFEGAVGGAGFVLACRLYAKFFTKANTALKPGRLLEKMQSWAFGFRLMLVLGIWSVVADGNLSQTVSKHPQTDLTVAATCFLVSANIIAGHLYYIFTPQIKTSKAVISA